MAFLLAGESLHLEYPTRVVFDGVTAGLNEGDRIGVVGRNGDGKSSLLRLLAGRLEPDGGWVRRRGDVRIGMLTQEDALASGVTVRAAIVGDQPLSIDRLAELAEQDREDILRRISLYEKMSAEPGFKGDVRRAIQAHAELHQIKPHEIGLCPLSRLDSQATRGCKITTVSH